MNTLIYTMPFGTFEVTEGPGSFLAVNEVMEDGTVKERWFTQDKYEFWRDSFDGFDEDENFELPEYDEEKLLILLDSAGVLMNNNSDNA